MKKLKKMIKKYLEVETLIIIMFLCMCNDLTNIGIVIYLLILIKAIINCIILENLKGGE